MISKEIYEVASIESETTIDIGKYLDKYLIRESPFYWVIDIVANTCPEPFVCQ